MSIESVPTLFYNTISNKCFEVINVIKDYLSGNSMTKYHKITENNLCAKERIMIMSETHEKLGISENNYIYNGYILNSSDRVIILDIEAGGICYSGSFPYVSDPKNPESLKYINSFIINKRILDEIDISTDAGNVQIFRLAYSIAKRYFINALKTENNPINIIEKRTYKIISTHSKKYGITNDTIFYVDFLITMIMILDTMFDLKFADIHDVKSAFTFNDTNHVLDNCFEEIYNYSIDTNPDPEDYMKIFKKLFGK